LYIYWHALLFYVLDGKENTAPEAETGAVAKEESSSLSFLHPVASIHVALRERQARRKALFTSCGPYKRALSARRDLAIRFVFVVPGVCKDVLR
jgi:hypothetical protein